MLSTVEVRWFGHGIPPTAVSSWFDGCPGEAEDQPWRRDFYLAISDGTDLGIKLREGGLEIKQRRSSLENLHLGQALTGCVEGWIKWRFPLDVTALSMADALVGDNSWVSIDKARRVKRYAVRGSSIAPVAVPVTQPFDGCQVELTDIRAGTGPWWTVGIEAIGEGSTGLERLLAIAYEVFELAAPADFSDENSYGYPRWLASAS